MSAPYKKILIFGATSGIGLALAERYVETGTHVIAVGRRKENLDKFANKYKGKVSTKVFDIGELDKIPKFVEEVTSEHPDVDAVFLNSGIQRGFNFTRPESVDLSLLDTEVTVNYISYLHITALILPFLLKKKSYLIFTTSGLSLVPLPRCPNYCATKAALHHFILALRRQLQGTSVTVVELAPPAVQTELHDESKQPDIKGGRHIGMTIEEFMAEAWPLLVEGREEIPIGFAITAFQRVDGPRKEMFAHMPWDPDEFKWGN